MPVTLNNLFGPVLNPSLQSVRSWLARSGEPLSSFSDRHLRDFLTNTNGTYGFLQAALFRSDLMQYLVGRVRVERFQDYGFGDRRQSMYDFALRLPMLRLIEQLRPDRVIPIDDGGFTADDLFVISMLLQKEIGLFTTIAAPWQQLYVGCGRETRVRSMEGYRFVLHTHPTMSTAADQIDDDITKAAANTIELVVAGRTIFVYTRNLVLTPRSAAVLRSDALTATALRTFETAVLLELATAPTSSTTVTLQGATDTSWMKWL
jgi:hypothetical protein